MIIRKKRILSVGNNIRGIKRGEKITLGIRGLERFTDRLIEIGFTKNFEEGEIILPAAVGPRSRFNAEGGYKIHKDKPMETAYRLGEWKWQEFRGRYDRVEQSKIVEIPYKRYPRTFIPPPAVEFTIKKLENDDKILASPEIEFSENNDNKFLHIINLYLEFFRECELFRQDLSPVAVTRLVRLNWEVLPPGRMPWSQLQNHLRPILDRQPEGNRAVIDKRHETISSHNPEFVAVGHGGFDGYVIFGFPSKSLFILESTEINNATYVLDRDWEELSSMTKAELLNNDLHKYRIIHRENWFKSINQVLKMKN